MGSTHNDWRPEVVIAMWNRRAGDREPAAAQTPEPSTLASATCCAAPPELVEAFKEINRHIELLEIDGRLGMSGSIVAARKQQELLVTALCKAQHNAKLTGVIGEKI